MKMGEIERLDLRTLKNLITLKESNTELLKLERRRERLRVQLDEVEQEIRQYLHGQPRAKALLDSLRAAAIGQAKGQRVNRPPTWSREHVTATLRRSKKPLTPAEIRDVIGMQHPDQATKNLYISVFQLLKRNAEFQKTKDGWDLRARRARKK